MKWIYTSLIMCFLLLSCKNKEAKVANISIIPKPLSMEIQNGEFELNKGTKISFSDNTLKPSAHYLASIIEKATKSKIHIQNTHDYQNQSINLAIDTSISNNQEAYSLVIDNKKIVLKGASKKGVFLGIQTIRQLLPADFGTTTNFNAWAIPAIKIIDQPVFGYRGVMLDISRHFFTEKEIHNLINLMALYKFNKLHIHLTDDQGWRLEIKKYPLLIKSAFRKFNNHDSTCMELAKKEDNNDLNLNPNLIKINGKDSLYGGYYTQDQMRNIVTYAGKRGIDIIPEIDMPGHFLSVLAQYPQLSCFNKTGWGQSFSTPLCLGKDSSIEFCENILQEIFNIFPYKYVHIGGDEVEMTNWKKCPNCQRRIKKENLKNEDELQSWFNSKIEKFLNQHGKQLIGWDEITKDKLSNTSTIMYWRPWAKDAVKKATSNHNYVIQSPDGPLYLDAQQNKKTLKTVYDYNPITPDLSTEQAQYILGAQGNLWAEKIPTEARLQYMAIPRLFALSELCWTKNKDWNDFKNRLPSAFARMDNMHIKYRIPDLTGFYPINAFVGKTTVKVNCMLKNITIRYTTDGSNPNENSTLYTKPFIIDKTTKFKFRSFYPNGQKGDIFEAIYNKQEYAPTITLPNNIKNGFKCDWHKDFLFNKCVNISKTSIFKSYATNAIIIPNNVAGKFGLIFNGFVKFPSKDIYTITLTSDDGSSLYIRNKLVIDNDGPHSAIEKQGQIALDKGWHPIKVMYFDMNNGGELSMHIYNSKGKEIELNNSNVCH